MNLFDGLWDIFKLVVKWFGANVMTIEIAGVSLLNWIIGFLVVGGLASLVMSLRPAGFALPSRDEVQSSVSENRTRALNHRMVRRNDRISRRHMQKDNDDFYYG